MRETTYTKLLGYELQRSAKAVKFQVAEDTHPELGGRTFWFPFSQISYQKKSHSMEDFDEIDVADWIIDTKIREE